MSDRLVRFPGRSWQEIEALPQPMRWTVQRTIFRLLDEPVPTLADPFPLDDPLPGAYELHLAADYVTIWYTITVHEGQEIFWRLGRGDGVVQVLILPASRCPGFVVNADPKEFVHPWLRRA